MAGVKTAVIGVGNMGLAHATCLAEGKAGELELTAVCDVDPDRLSLCRERFAGVLCYPDWRKLLEEENVQAVIIAVPASPARADRFGPACARGCIRLWKSRWISRFPGENAQRRARESGRVFAVMLNQRTNPLFRRCREIVRSGELGTIKRSVWIITNWYRTQHYYDSGAWRATWAGEGGGVLLNQAPHHLDLWQWICGMPVSVTGYCETAKYHHIEVEDEATLFVRYANGATGTFMTSTGEYPGTNRLEICGTRGKIVLENGALKWWRLCQPEEKVRFESCENAAEIGYDYTEILPGEPESAHPGILRNFAAAILNGEPLIAPGEEGEKPS